MKRCFGEEYEHGRVPHDTQGCPPPPGVGVGGGGSGTWVLRTSPGPQDAAYALAIPYFRPPGAHRKFQGLFVGQLTYIPVMMTPECKICGKWVHGDDKMTQYMHSGGKNDHKSHLYWWKTDFGTWIH